VRKFLRNSRDPAQSGFLAVKSDLTAEIDYALIAGLLLFASVIFLFPSSLLAATSDTSKRLPAIAIDPALSQQHNTDPATVQGLTRQQGDAILRELRSIRVLLQKQQQTSKKPRRQVPTSATIKLADQFSLGNTDAPVTMVEFTDYQCPYCKRFHDTTFSRLREKYIDTGKLRYVTMDLPLKFHQQARPAANAARCAGEQGSFWQMRKTLFSNPRALGRQALLAYASDLSLDVSAFQVCLDENRHEKAIQTDIQAARRAGFTGTPSFVIGKNVNGQVNGVTLIGSKPLLEFENQIQRLLPKAGG